MPYRRGENTNWYIRVRGIRQSAGTASRKDAEALEAKLNAEAWQVEHLDRKPARSWPELVVEWARARSHKASWNDDRSRLRWWDQHLGHVTDLRHITRRYIDSVMHEHRGAGSQPSSANATANRYCALVGAMLNLAARELEWLQAAPKMPHYPELAALTLWLTVEQWRRLEACLPDHLLGPVTFALATGLRQGKVLDLRWTQIDLAGRWMQHDGSDNKRGNVLPLNDTAMSVIRAARARRVVHATHVFTFRGHPMAKPKLGWYAALQRAGLGDWIDGQWDGFHWHGLRHTFNSWLGQRGVPEEIRKRLCGWSSGAVQRGSIVARYTHYDLDHLRPYAAIIDSVLDPSSSQCINSNRALATK